MLFTKRNKRILMGIYNAARKAANEGRTYKGKVLEIGRVNKAFGILQSNEYEREYEASHTTCNCPDAKYHPNTICKHQLAAMMEYRIMEIERNSYITAERWEWLKVEAVYKQIDMQLSQPPRKKSAAEHLKDLGF